REDSESGAEVYAGTLSAGGQETFASSQRYWMMVGRPEVLAVSVNGASYTLTAPDGTFVVTGAGVERSQ
ncbi:MAG: RodZ domain-containing protein, partial [bacterium]